MEPRDIRAMLRGATKAKVIQGWYWYGWGESIHYVVHPNDGPTSTYTVAGAVGYCDMLRQAAVEPLYRGGTS